MISSEAPEDETAQLKVAVVFLEAMLYKAFEYTEAIYPEGGKNMTFREVNEVVLSKVPEEKKEAFIEAISACRSKSEKLAVLKKFDIQLTEKELEEISSSKVAEEDLDLVTGGCDADCCDPYFSPSLKS